jgi:hypothetical protein
MKGLSPKAGKGLNAATGEYIDTIANALPLTVLPFSQRSKAISKKFDSKNLLSKSRYYSTEYLTH